MRRNLAGALRDHRDLDRRRPAGLGGPLRPHVRRAHALAALVLVALPAAPAAAQTVRGRVVEMTTGAAIGNGFVVLVDSAGRELARALTDAEGRYFVRAPGPGTYQLRSERIGFRVALSDPLSLGATETLDYQLTISPIPVRLSTIEIGTESSCAGRPGESQATAEIWEEARKALTAVAWSQEQGRLQVRMQTYRRELTTGLRVHQEQRQEKSGPAVKPFGSPPAAELARLGFVQTSADSGLLFYGPDADVLFSDAFLTTHCFRARAGSGETEGHIGLAFEPVRGRSRPDIEGTIWLDASSATLKSVEFHYANFRIPGASEPAGGRVEFAHLPNGAWIASRYAIRMPIIREERRWVAGMMTARPEFYGYREDGGEVIDILDAGGATLAAAPRATLAGAVRSATGASLASVPIRLDGTGYETVTDAQGRFALRELPDGEYTLAIRHPDFPLLGWIPGPEVALGAGDSVAATLTVPGFDRLYAMVCGPADTAATGALIGSVRDSLDRPVPGARVRAAWSGWDLIGAAGTPGLPGRIQNRWEQVVSAADSLGYFRLCGLPADKLVEAWVELPGGGTGATVKVYPVRDSMVQQALGTDRARPPDAAFRGADLTLRGTVVDSVTGAPLDGVTVGFVGLPASGQRTGRDGRFRLSDVPAVRSVIELRRIGFAPRAVAVDASGPAGAEIPLDTIRLTPVAIALDSIAVEAEMVQRNPVMADFLRRRERRIGQFVTQVDITRQGTRRTSDAIRRMSGVEVRCEQAGGGKAEAPCRILNRRALEPCELDIVVDGLRSTLPIDEIPVAWIAGIEVYSGSTAPAIFSQRGCGVVVIWTDRGNQR